MGGGRGGPDGNNEDKNKHKNQGGPILSPLVGSKIRDLRPVPRRKPNKNKGLSVLTKMRIVLTPASVLASRGWRKNCARRGLAGPLLLSSDRDALQDLQTWCSGYVSVLGDENTCGYWILGLLCQLWPRKFHPRGDLKKTMPTAAIHMGDGHVVHSCGDCEVDVPMGSRSIARRFYVMDTEAFDFVLGTNFFVEHSQTLSLTLQAPYVLQVDHGDGGESVPLEQSEHTSSYLKVCKKEPSTMMVASKTEDYRLLGDVLDQGLKELGYSREDLNVESFASDKQHNLDLYCS